MGGEGESGGEEYCNATTLSPVLSTTQPARYEAVIYHRLALLPDM